MSLGFDSCASWSVNTFHVYGNAGWTSVWSESVPQSRIVQPSTWFAAWNWLCCAGQYSKYPIQTENKEYQNINTRAESEVLTRWGKTIIWRRSSGEQVWLCDKNNTSLGVFLKHEKNLGMARDDQVMTRRSKPTPSHYKAVSSRATFLGDTFFGGHVCRRTLQTQSTGVWNRPHTETLERTNFDLFTHQSILPTP